MYDAFQKAAEGAVQPQRVSVADAVSSKTLTSAFSTSLPFLVVTRAMRVSCLDCGRVEINSVSQLEGVHLFLPPILFTQTRILASWTSCPPLI